MQRFSRSDWDTTWETIAKDIGRRSLCVRSQVGAVITDPSNRPVAVGYNGPPAGFPHKDKPCTSWCTRSRGFQRFSPSYEDCPAIHAEANALLVCDRRDREGGTIYTTSHVCYPCAKLISNSGLHKVVVRPDGASLHRSPDQSYDLLRSSGLEVHVVES